MFYKSSQREKYFCVLSALSIPLHKTSSRKSYQVAGEKMMQHLGDKLDKKVLEGDFYLSGFSFKIRSLETPQKEELNLLKNSLDKFVQENQLSMRLKVA